MLRTTFIVLLLALAGCTSPPPEAATNPDPVPTPPTPSEPALLLHVDPVGTTRNETTRIVGTVNQPSRVSIGAMNQESNGAWSFELPVEPGRTELTIVADTGTQTQSETLLVVREISGTLEVRFNRPDKTDRADIVWFDPDALASAPDYVGRDMAHPPYATVHDVMTVWSQQTGVVVKYGYSNGLGFSVQQIDGVGVPLEVPSASNSYWCYDYNGALADKGVSLQDFHAGDVVTWSLACR